MRQSGTLMMLAEQQAPLILVVEDDASLGQWMAEYLTAHGFQVSVATRGDVVLPLIRKDEPDLIILDLSLPGLDGLEICRQARQFYTRPILMLTARDEESDEVLGLERGADDYLAKPVKPGVLLARIRALLRRGNFNRGTDLVTLGELCIDVPSRSVTLAGATVNLSRHEFDVLYLLVIDAGKPVQREQLLGTLRGIEYDGFDRSVDICISRLRRKLGDQGDAPVRIKTLRGIGYMLAPDAW